MITLNEKGPQLPREGWLHRLGLERSGRAKILQTPPMPQHAQYFFQSAVSRIPIEVVIENDLAAAWSSTGEAASAAAAALVMTRFPDSTVTVKLSGDATVHLPGGGPLLSAPSWLQAVACALIVRDEAALDIFFAPPNIAAAQLPHAEADDFWPFLCAGAASVLARPEAAKGWLSEAEGLMKDRYIRNTQPDYLRMQVMPLLTVLKALAGEGDWTAAQDSAVSLHNAYYEEHGGAGNPNRLLPIVLCGLTAAAMDRGIASSSGQLPESFLHPAGKWASELSLQRDPRFAEEVSDPSVLLDMEGVPSEQRRHTIFEKDGKTIARYRIGASPGIPAVTMDFVLPGQGEEREKLRPALDPGERARAAEQYASSPANREHLREAVDQIDLVLQSIPPDDDAVPSQAFVNPVGIQVYRSEPGRFDRDRLQAYRDSLRRTLATLVGDKELPPRPTTTSELLGYSQVMAASEVIKEGVEPMLKQLVMPAGRELVGHLRPRPGDYESVFSSAAVDRARKAYASFWSRPVEVERSSSQQTDVLIFAAPAGMLRGPNDLSRNFPAGYQSIAKELKPERVWLAWKYVKPGETSGMAYDGLVWIDDHWAWFPRPYRVLRQ
jgi:Immunity protein 49